MILVKRADGQWSVPAMLNAGETSLGVQAGGSTVETVYIVTDAETPRRLPISISSGSASTLP